MNTCHTADQVFLDPTSSSYACLKAQYHLQKRSFLLFSHLWWWPLYFFIIFVHVSFFFIYSLLHHQYIDLKLLNFHFSLLDSVYVIWLIGYFRLSRPDYWCALYLTGAATFSLDSFRPQISPWLQQSTLNLCWLEENESRKSAMGLKLSVIGRKMVTDWSAVTWPVPHSSYPCHMTNPQDSFINRISVLAWFHSWQLSGDSMIHSSISFEITTSW